MESHSWVIVDRETNKAVWEVYSRRTVESINLKRYKVVPILEYLQGLNRAIKEKGKLP